MANELELPAEGGGETFIQALCEDCGESSMFSSRFLGTVQECPRCGKFMDVMSAADREAWNDLEFDSEDEDEPDD